MKKLMFVGLGFMLGWYHRDKTRPKTTLELARLEERYDTF